MTSNLEEHLDHIHYLQDIFLLGVDSLNNVLKEQLMNRLFIPVYIFSWIKREKFSRVKVRLNEELGEEFGCFLRIHELCSINCRHSSFLLK